MGRSSFSQRTFWIRAWLTTLLGSIVGATPAYVRAGDGAWQPSGFQPIQTTTLDLQLNLRTREVIANDPALGPLNLRVEVRQGIAIVYGSVPTQADARRVEGRLLGIAGIYRVQNYLSVQAERKPEIALPTSPPWRERNPAPAPSSNALAHRPGDDGRTITPELSWRPRTSGPLAIEEKPPAQPPLAWQPAVQLAMPAPQVQPRIREAPPIVSTGAPVALMSQTPPSPAVNYLPSSLAAIRQSQPRFRSIGIDVRAGVVTLHGASSPEAAFEMAQLTARVPGVERVVVDVRPGLLRPDLFSRAH